MATTEKRPYDGRKRQARAEEERRATRRRVLAAAQRLFVAKGYAATTMADIARDAGVAMQSVYKSGKSKADLLQRVVEVVVAGDDEDMLMSDRPSFTGIAAEEDPQRKVELMAALVADIQERSMPVQAAFRQAAAVDASVAANLDAELRRRHETFATVIAMIPESRLRRSPEESTDIAWAVGSTELFLLLRVRQGWDADRYREWLSATLIEQLLLANR
ncbi:MAG TPA: helix-turn-helix domain-containing protein [Acidimicrobiales bacterium]|nr:helix-turn-helix domain-containing protein [Acidimicrobiales bacterium]